MQIKEKVPLAPLHTFSLRNQAVKLILIDSERDLQELYQQGFFEEPYILLGEGSNTIFLSDVDKPILKIRIPGIQSFYQNSGSAKGLVNSTPSDQFVMAGAGVNWDELVQWSVNQQLGGIENLSLIPGTCGAAPVQNIGAYGVELSDIFSSLTCFDTTTGEVKTMSAEECRFQYRDSIFKQSIQNGGLKGRVIILSITLRLSNSPDYRSNLSYQGVTEELTKSYGTKAAVRPTLKQVREAVCNIRRAKLPDPDKVHNAGSFFKNPIISRGKAEEIATQFAELPQYVLENGEVKIPAGWLMDRAGWKGKRVGSLGTWPQQALVVTQDGNATGIELLEFIQAIQSDVFNQFGIHLEPEVNLVEG